MLISEIAQYLHNQGLGVRGGLNSTIFENFLPPTPDECIAIFQHGGVSPSPLNDYKTPSMQFIVRSNPQSPSGAIIKGEAIINALNGFNSGYFVEGGLYIVDVQFLQSSPESIGQDKNERYEFSFNMLVEYKEG